MDVFENPLFAPKSYTDSPTATVDNDSYDEGDTGVADRPTGIARVLDNALDGIRMDSSTGRIVTALNPNSSRVPQQTVAMGATDVPLVFPGLQSNGMYLAFRDPATGNAYTVFRDRDTGEQYAVIHDRTAPGGAPIYEEVLDPATGLPYEVPLDPTTGQ